MIELLTSLGEFLLNAFAYFRRSAARKSLFYQKGFIGPIGDDLPSIVPIVVALLLFFSIFALALSTYNSANDLIRKQTDMTSVARGIKGDSLILGIEQFKEKCSELAVKKYPYSFMIGIYSTDFDTLDAAKEFVDISTSSDEGYADSDSTSFLKQKRENGSTSAFFCSYDRVGGKEFSAAKKNYLLRFYPVAVQLPVQLSTGEHYLIVPALMAMVFWE